MSLNLSQYSTVELDFVERVRIVESLNIQSRMSYPQTYSKTLLKEYEATGNGTECSGLWGVKDKLDVPIMTFFSKMLRPNTQHWDNEKKFYTQIAKSIDLDTFTIPRYYGERLHSNGVLEIFLEYCDGFHWIKGLEDKLFAAEQFGKFSGLMAGRPDAYSSVRLNKTPGCRANLPIEWLTNAVDKVILDKSDKTQIIRIFEEFIGNSEKWKKIYWQCPQTLIHADANDCNLLTNKSRSDLLVVDWGQIAIGRLGEDLCRLCAPWFVLQENVISVENLAKIEEAMLLAYLRGIRTSYPAVSEGDVRLAYQIRSVSFGLSIFRFYCKRYDTFKSAADRAQLTNALKSYISLLSSRSLALLSEYGAV